MSTVAFRVRVLSVCVHWNFQIIWTVFQIDVKISDACIRKRKVFSVDVPNNHSLERENSNFTGDYFRDSTCMVLRNAWEFQMNTPQKYHRSRTFLRFQMLVVVMIREGPLLWEKILFFLHIGYRTVLFFFPLNSKSSYLYLSKLLASLFLQR